MALSSANISGLRFEPITEVRRRSTLIRDQSQPTMRTLATRADADATTELDLATLWSELSRGLCKVTDSYFSESRCYLLTRASAGQAKPVSESALRVLQAVLNECSRSLAQTSPWQLACRAPSSR